MKKTILFWTLSFALFQPVVRASAIGLDTVTLSNGTEVRGTILESSNQRVKIKAEDGTLMVFDMTEVRKIDRAPAPVPEPAMAPTQSGVAPNQTWRGPGLRKNPRFAFRMSCFIPGGGQFYNGENGKGALQLGLFIGGLAVAIAQAPRYEYNVVDYYDDYGYYIGSDTVRSRTGGNDAACTAGIVVAAGAWIWSIIDAPVGADNYNRHHGMTLYENPLKNRTLAVEPVLFNAKNQPQSGMQVAYRF